jgi:hypothetical protein
VASDDTPPPTPPASAVAPAPSVAAGTPTRHNRTLQESMQGQGRFPAPNMRHVRKQQQ